MKRYIVIVAMMLALGVDSLYAKGSDEVNEQWQRTMISAIDSFPQHGGYYVGRKVTPDFPRSAWRGLNEAFQMHPSDMKPYLNAVKVQPSFCSLATYAVLIKALTMWDADNVICREAWYNMKPYCGVVDMMNPKGFNQNDGEGCWGRANANGPGLAVLVNDVKAGYSFTAFRGAKTDKCKETPKEVYMTDEEWCNDPVWSRAERGDLMKIFWNRNETKCSDSGAIIGCNGVADDEQEHGHSVVFMGYNDNGEVMYWSSNGPGESPKDMGYSVASCNKTAIQRVVFTRITKPENFTHAKSITPSAANKWLQKLNGTAHGTTVELKKNCGIK